MQNNKSLAPIVIIPLCFGIIGFLAWDLFGKGEDVGPLREVDVVPPASTSTAPLATTTTAAEQNEESALEQMKADEQTTVPVNNSKPSMTNESKTPNDATEAELIARLKELIPKMAAYYARDETTPAEEAEFESLNSEKDALVKQLEEKDTDGIEAVLQVDAYGYDVKVLVNGSDVGISGGSSESSRLFNKEHYSYQLAAPGVSNLYVLKKGENTLSIIYKKQTVEENVSDGSVTVYRGANKILEVSLTGEGSTIEKVVTLGV